MADLPLQPDYSSRLSKSPRVSKPRFGDGYEQRIQIGINNNMQRWALNYSELDDGDAQMLLDFFDSLEGAATFTWQPPFSSVVRKFVAEDYFLDPVDDNDSTFTVSIYEVPEA